MIHSVHVVTTRAEESLEIGCQPICQQPASGWLLAGWLAARGCLPAWLAGLTQASRTRVFIGDILIYSSDPIEIVYCSMYSLETF